MDKKQLIGFITQKKKGIYNLLIEVYADVLTASMSTPMALEVIRQDLQSLSNDPIELNLSSLLKAMAKAKKKGVLKSDIKQWDFKDSHELKDQQRKPGSFKIV